MIIIILVLRPYDEGMRNEELQIAVHIHICYCGLGKVEDLWNKLILLTHLIIC